MTSNASYRKLAACLPFAAAALGSALVSSAEAPAPALGLSASSTSPKLQIYSFHHENVLGTSLSLTVRCANATEAHRAEAAVLQVFDHDTALLSTWRSDSEASRWARTRFQAVPVSPELFHVLSLYDAWRDRTGGALDASTEAAARLWSRAAADNRTPTAHEIALTREAIQQPHWSLDAQRQTATRLTDVPLAFGSFTKSFITDRAAEAALRAGIAGVMLNVGGDIVVRGDLTQVVGITNPSAASDNQAEDALLDHVVLRNGAVATSGSYRRGFRFASDLQDPSATQPRFSHLINPATASPASGVLSSTVVAADPVTAGALATAFAILPVQQSRALAATVPGAQYLLVLAGGEQVRGSAPSSSGGLHTAAFLTGPTTASPAKPWNSAYELTLNLDLPRIDDARYRRPYVAVWVEDADHFPVRTLALWTQNPRWLPDLKQWYRDDQVRNLVENTDLSRTVSAATRPPGHYTLKWDGKDNEGKLVKSGKYTVLVEASREHGGYDLQRHELDFNGVAQQVTLPSEKELGATTLDYNKR